MIMYVDNYNSQLSSNFYHQYMTKVTSDNLQIEINRAFTLFPVNVLVNCFFYESDTDDISITTVNDHDFTQIDVLHRLAEDLNFKLNTNELHKSSFQEFFLRDDLKIVNFGINKNLLSTDHIKNKITKILSIISDYEHEADE